MLVVCESPSVELIDGIGINWHDLRTEFQSGRLLQCIGHGYIYLICSTVQPSDSNTLHTWVVSLIATRSIFSV
jgi:hypothetical protein